eukprot:m.307284 g.307284  ORF g.307284 m.307284 type:complete len:509 (-) comp23022_c5_seq5:537-2063(-)
MSSPAAEEWVRAMSAELDSLQANGTWELVPRHSMPSGAKALHTKWVYRTKHLSDGETERRARLVVLGNHQRPGFDFDADALFAPVCQRTTFRVFFAVAAAQGTPVYSMDVRSAFLNAELDEEVYVQPPELLGAAPQQVCRLRKTLYGLRQSPRAWSAELDKFLVSEGLTRSKADPCLYCRQDGKEFLRILVYVDDLQLTGSSDDVVQRFKDAICNRFKMHDEGLSTDFLGMRVTQSNGAIRLDQERYASEVLQRFGMADCKPLGTPLEPGTVLSPGDDQSELLSADQASVFRGIVGALLFLGSCTRPDLAFSTHQLSKVMAAPTQKHLIAAKRVLRYLQGTKSLGITFSRSGVQRPQLHGFTDASWNSEARRRSTSGFVFLMTGGAVSWRTKMQSVAALSTAESEYYAMAEAVREVLFLRNLLMELGCPQRSPTSLLEDNQATIKIATNAMTTSRTKHIDLRQHFVRDVITAGDVVLEYCPTADMVADELTKALSKAQHVALRGFMMG